MVEEVVVMRLNYEYLGRLWKRDEAKETDYESGKSGREARIVGQCKR
jgi:hypothetical protein